MPECKLPPGFRQHPRLPVSPSSSSPSDLSCFSRHASSIGALSSSRPVPERMPSGAGWIAIAVLAAHWLVWIVMPGPASDLSGNAPQRTAMRVTMIAPAHVSEPVRPASVNRRAPAVQSPQRGKATPAARVPVPPDRTAAPFAPSSAPPQALPSAAMRAPALDWRADVARAAGERPASSAAPSDAGAERAITDQSQRARLNGTPPAEGNVARRAFEREFGSGRASVSGPNASREGGNPLGTTECIEMNGKRVCSRQRSRAADIDPFMKREHIFSPVRR